MKKIQTYMGLHLMLMVYSICSVCSKKASSEELFSIKFLLYYGCVFFLLVVYAIIWQQIIKKMPLTTAYANKAVTVVWGIVWGMLFFDEFITVGKIVGAILVGVGIVIYSLADSKENNHESG